MPTLSPKPTSTTATASFVWASHHQKESYRSSLQIIICPDGGILTEGLDRFESSGEATRARMQVVPEDELWLHLSRAQFFASISNGTNRQFLVGNAPCLSLILVNMCPRVKSFGCSGTVISGLTHLYKANLLFFPLFQPFFVPRQRPSDCSLTKCKDKVYSFVLYFFSPFQIWLARFCHLGLSWL